MYIHINDKQDNPQQLQTPQLQAPRCGAFKQNLVLPKISQAKIAPGVNLSNLSPMIVNNTQSPTISHVVVNTSQSPIPSPRRSPAMGIVNYGQSLVNIPQSPIPSPRRSPATGIIICGQPLVNTSQSPVTSPRSSPSCRFPINTTGETTSACIVPKIGTVQSPRRSPSINMGSLNLTPPSSPGIIPKIGMVNGKKTICKIQTLLKDEPLLKPGENPWLPKANIDDGLFSGLTIASITPIGTIAKVPTTDIRPQATPRRLQKTPTRQITLNVIDQNTGMTRIDPLLTATIYLDCTKPEDRDYNYVSERMRNITANTLKLQKQYSTEYKQVINIEGLVSYDMFEEALSIYENNQVYYQDRIDDKSLDINSIQIGLTELEYWFVCIIEPKQHDDIAAWKDRELFKLNKGRTSYCDPELYKYITVFPEQLRNKIKQYHYGLI